MNIELDEVVLLDVTDDTLELAAGGAQGGMWQKPLGHVWLAEPLLAIADR